MGTGAGADAVSSLPSSKILQYVEALEVIVLYVDLGLSMSRDEFVDLLPAAARPAFLEVMAAWDAVAEPPDSPEAA